MKVLCSLHKRKEIPFMKKRILLLSTAALLSLGALGGCNKDDKKSSDEPTSEAPVDPEENWPVKEWSSEEKAVIESVLGSGNTIPFYYIKDQTVKAGKKSGVMTLVISSTNTEAFSTDDLSAYVRKLLRFGYEACDDSSSSTYHYRVKLSSDYVFDHYIDVKFAIVNKKSWTINAILGDEVRNHSFAGRDAPYGASKFATLNSEISQYFASSGIKNALVLPTAIEDETAAEKAITSYDFIDMRYKAMDAKKHPSSSSEDLPVYYYDSGAPAARFVFTSTDDKIALAEERVNAAYASAFNKIVQNDSNFKIAGAYRSESGFELSVSSSKVDKEEGIPAKVNADFAFQEVHDFSGKYHRIFDNGSGDELELGIGSLVERYINAEVPSEGVEISFPVIEVGSSFTAVAKDVRFSNWSKTKIVGNAQIEATLVGVTDPLEGVTQSITVDAGYTAVGESGGVYTFTKGNCTLTMKYTASALNTVVLTFTYGLPD